MNTNLDIVSCQQTQKADLSKKCSSNEPTLAKSDITFEYDT